jgi:hypothetical protein
LKEVTMTDQTTRDILARLQEHEQALQALRPARRTRRPAMRPRLLAALGLALLIAVMPLTLLAANPFTDLNPGSVHNNDIDLLFNAGITAGCTPTEYCPNANVTREQMATFLARTAGLGNHPPVVDAKTLAGYAPNGLVRVSQNSNASAEGTVPVAAQQNATPTVAATVTINAPSSGYILVTANAMFRFTGCATCTTVAVLGDATATFSAGEATLVPVSLTWVVSVDQAMTAEIPLYFVTTRPGAAVPIPSATIANPNITALFVPFNKHGDTLQQTAIAGH